MDTNYKVLMTLMGMEIGGAETHVLELCRALKKKNVDVYVASNGGAYETELKAAGISHFSVPLHNKKLTNILSAYKGLAKIIKENDIKLVHAHARIPAFICGLLQKKFKFRFVTTAHLNFKTSFLLNMLTNWGEGTLAVSEDIKEYLITNYNVSAENIQITINGIDPEKFSPDIDYSSIISEFGFDINKRHILSTSRLDRDRSLAAHLLVESAEEIYHVHNDIEIIIVGGGNDFDALRQKAESVNKRLGFGLIKLTGSRVDVNKFIAFSDIYIGVSRAALEAMSAAKPCIVAGNDGYIGIFNESKLNIGINTNFCCRGCPISNKSFILSDTLEILGKSKEELKRLGNYGRSVIAQYYSVEKMADDALALYETVRTSSRPIDIMVSGYYGFKNHGDDIVLKSMIDSFLELDKELKITVLSMRPKETSLLYGVQSVNRYNLPKILHLFNRTNLLVSGGGSLLQDITSTHSLFYYLYLISAAHRRCVKTMLYANGVSIRRDKNIKYVLKVLNKMDLLTLRDDTSFKFLKDLGIRGTPMRLTADIAFSVKCTDRECGARLLERIGVEQKYFCIAIRNWKFLRDGFENEIAYFADYINEVYSMQAVFIPMQPNNDEDISKRTMSLMKYKSYFIGTDYSLNEILGIVSGSQFVLGMRLHTIIYAIKAGVPVIGLVYDPKVRAMMQMTGQDYFANVEGVSSEQLKKFADIVIADRGNISKKILDSSKNASASALENTRLAYELIKRKEF